MKESAKGADSLKKISDIDGHIGWIVNTQLIKKNIINI